MIYDIYVTPLKQHSAWPSEGSVKINNVKVLHCIVDPPDLRWKLFLDLVYIHPGGVRTVMYLFVLSNVSNGPCRCCFIIQLHLLHPVFPHIQLQAMHERHQSASWHIEPAHIFSQTAQIEMQCKGSVLKNGTQGVLWFQFLVAS